MPQAIIPVVANWLIGLGVTAVAAWAIATVAVTAVFALGLRALSPKGNKGASAQDPGRQFMVRSTVEPRRLIYGRDKVSGVLVYASTTGTDNRYAHFVIALATHECDAIESIWFNDELVGSRDGSGNVTSGKFAGTARIKIHLGQSGQVADTDLVAEDPTRWTSSHRGDGITYIYVRLEYNRDVYPTGLPNVSAVVRGKKLYDPRDGTTAWSNNPALVIRDYLTNEYGLNCDAAEIDDATFIAAANIADESVIVDAGFETRYTCDGSVSLGERRLNIMEQLLSTGMRLTYSQGQYKLYAEAYRTPVVTLTDDDLAGGLQVSPRTARQNLYNAVRGTYVDPESGYQSIDFPPARDPDYVDEDGGEEIYRDLALPYTNGSARAQRIAKIWQVRSRQSISFSALWKPKAFKVSALDNVYVTINWLGWTNKVFTVTDWRLQPDGSVMMSFQEEDSTTYLWTSENEVVIPDAPATNLPNPFAVAAPTGLTLASGTNEQVVTTGGQVVSRIKATWTAPADIYVKSGGTIEVQAKLSSDSAWTTYPPVKGDETLAYITPVKDGESYNVRIRAVNSLGVRSAFAQVFSHVVVQKANFDNYDNLIPNGNSEMGPNALNLSPEGNGLVNDVTNANDGNWCRKLTIPNTVQLTPTLVPVIAGETYYLEGYLKASTTLSQQAQLYVTFVDANNANAQTVTISSVAIGVAYQKVSGQFTIPAGKLFMRAGFRQTNAGDASRLLYGDAFLLKRVTKVEHLTPSLSASVLSSYYDDMSDPTAWVDAGSAVGATFVATAVTDSVFGGTVGRATNMVAKTTQRAIPFDETVLYRISFRVRQTNDPSSGTKHIYCGLLSYANETDSPIAPLSDAQWYAASSVDLVAGSGWTTFVAYVKGRNTAGSFASATNPANPSPIHSAARFIRPTFTVNYNNGSGGGVVDIDQVVVEALANPDGWINTAQITDNAVTTLADVTGADISDSTGNGISGTAVSVTFAATGKPVEITIYAPTVLMQADAFAPSVLRYTILKNGVSIGAGGAGDLMQLPTGQTQSRSFSYAYRDTPAAGTVTYGLFLQTVDTLSLNHPDVITITRPSIKIIEVKK